MKRRGERRIGRGKESKREEKVEKCEWIGEAGKIMM